MQDMCGYMSREGYSGFLGRENWNRLHRVRRRIKQSDLLAVSESSRAVDAAFERILMDRFALEAYARLHPIFELSLDPVRIDANAPQIVRLAGKAAEVASVGPMAAVPGALADLALEAMLKTGSRINLLENGGEIAASSTETLLVGIYAGQSKHLGLGFRLRLQDFPVGIATSSAAVSHALSFGQADAAVIVAETACMADAVATAVCNAVKGNDSEASIQSGLETVEKIGHVRGALVLRDRHMGTVGKLPELVRIEGGPEKMLKAGLCNSRQPDNLAA